jgi:hypothetical protein
LIEFRNSFFSGVKIETIKSLSTYKIFVGRPRGKCPPPPRRDPDIDGINILKWILNNSERWLDVLGKVFKILFPKNYFEFFPSQLKELSACYVEVCSTYS